MNLPEVKLEDLLESGVHFGHNVRRWNPKMKEYIYGVRNNIHIFDLRITLELLNTALVKIHETVSKSGKSTTLQRNAKKFQIIWIRVSKLKTKEMQLKIEKIWMRHLVY